MINLLEETKKVLKEHEKTFDDVLWVGTGDYYIDVQRFIELADKKYNNSYGTEYVNTDLHVVGTDWWLERHEYDGSEWWEYKTIPIKPNEKTDFSIFYK